MALKDVLLKSSSQKQGIRIANFKKLLKKRGDLKIATKVLREFKTLWLERNGKIGKVLSAKPLSQEAKGRAKRALAKKGFAYDEKTDPSLIGGMALLLGNEYYIDNTVRGKIEKLRAQPI